MEILIKGAQVIAALSILIILHEGGHFLFAKLFKTRVEKFYLFFDYKFHIFSTYDKWVRKLLGKKAAEKQENGEYKYEGTEYGIGWIPLGGYVKISGMIDESMDKEQMKQPPQPWEFRTKPAWQRLLIMLGGVIMNFLVAFAIYSMILFCWGESYVKPKDMTYGLKFNTAAKADGFMDGDIIISADGKDFDRWTNANLRQISEAKTVSVLRHGQKTTVKLHGEHNLLEMLEEPLYATELIPIGVDSVIPGTPAEKIGLSKGDKITKINDKVINDYNDLTATIASLQEKLDKNSTHADSLRQRTIMLSIKPAGSDTTRTVQAELTNEFRLGYSNILPEYKVSTKEYSFIEAIPAGVSYGCETLGSYVSDLKYVFTKKGARSVGGFIAIGNIFPSEWDWLRFWNLTALLSIMLGFMNVLPIPALDGGHAIFALYEIITRRKPSDKFLERAQYVGMFILIGLLVFANLNDILRIFGI